MNTCLAKTIEMGEEVKIIGAFPSSFCYSVEWALRLKGIDYEYIREDLSNKSPLLLESNPVYKKVPVLLHHEKPISESLVILEYIDETWKEHPLLPEDAYNRASARFWAKFADEKLIGSVRNVLFLQGKDQEAGVESLLQGLKILDEQLQQEKFFGGERVGFVDLVVGWIPQWVPVFEEVAGVKLLDAERFPSLARWAKNLMEVPAIKKDAPDQEKMLAYLLAVRQKRVSSKTTN